MGVNMELPQDSRYLVVPEDLFATAESSFYSGKFTCPVFSQGSDLYYFDKPLTYSFTITNTSGALLVMGTISGTARCACARCLEDALIDVDGEIEGYYLLPNSNRELTQEEEDEYVVLGEDRTIDLEPLFGAAISLALPLIPLCCEDCKGLCPQCGHNLNEGPCSCIEEEDDSNNPFAILKTLTFEEKDDDQS